MLKKIIIWFLLFVFTFQISHAKYNVNPKIEKVFNNFIQKIEVKLAEKKQLKFYKNLANKINTIVSKKWISSKKNKIFTDLLVLTNEQIFKLEGKKRLDNFSQKIIESWKVSAIKSEIKKIKIPSFLRYHRVIAVINSHEFVEKNAIKKIVFRKYISVNNINYIHTKWKEWIIIVKANGDIWFVESYTMETKIPYSHAQDFFKDVIAYNKKYIEEDKVFFTYTFPTYLQLPDLYWIYESEIKNEQIDIKSALLIIEKNNQYRMITNFKKTRLISSDIIYGVTDKIKFIDHLIDDKKYLSWDTDALFLELQNEISLLTQGLTNEKKIEIIYSWLLKKLTYTKRIDLTDKKIFSWILSYKNNDWVCEWYAKLNAYALMFAHVSWSDVIRWDVIDAEDFPKIWHAWLKIWDSYYDPTFDDPVENLSKKYTNKNYKYYKLPRDLFYTNRFNEWATPRQLKTKDIGYRINFSNQRLEKLASKYKKNNFLILQSVAFKNKYNVDFRKGFTLDSVKKILPYYKVKENKWGQLTFMKNWVQKNILKLQYFTVTKNSDLQGIFAQKNYNMNWLYLFHWTYKNGTTEYRIGFDVKIK